jgi:hypothetical protein
MEAGAQNGIQGRREERPVLELTIADDGCRKEEAWYYPFSYSARNLSILTYPLLQEVDERELDAPYLRGRVKYIRRGGRVDRVVSIYGSSQLVVVRHKVSDCRGGSLDRAWLVKGRSAVPVEIKREVAAELERRGAGLYEKVFVEVPGYGRFVLEERRLGRADPSNARITVSVGYDFTSGVVYITGNTYHIKEHLKRMRFRWNDTYKAWEKKASLEEAKKLIEEVKRIPRVFVESEDWEPPHVEELF